MKTKTKQLMAAVAFAMCEAVCSLTALGGGESASGWTVVYGNLNGCEARAVELLTGELGDLLLREPGVYAAHVLPCRKAEDVQGLRGNLFIVGTPGSNAALSAYLHEEDVPEGGYLVKTVEEADRDVVILCGATPAAAIWAVADFCSDGIAALRPLRGGDGIFLYRDVFGGKRRLLRRFDGKPIAPYVSRRQPKTDVRSFFTWGHPIDDYREYVRNLARLKMNRVYFWNDYPPLNAREVVDYAHSWGVEVFWGFPWGWDTSCGDQAKLDLADIERRTLEDWRRNWRDLPGDGIYFQTFTETAAAKVAGETVASRAIRLVNAVAAKMFEEKPSQKIVFGLHAQSVRGELGTVARADPRLEILWENTGGFPYSTAVRGDEGKDAAFNRTILADERHAVGVVWKCQLMQDWSNWTHQEGPYLMGVTSRRTYDADRLIQDGLWRDYGPLWVSHIEEARAAALLAQSIGRKVEMNAAAQINGPIRFPTAVMAEFFWDATEPADRTLGRVLARRRE